MNTTQKSLVSEACSEGTNEYNLPDRLRHAGNSRLDPTGADMQRFVELLKIAGDENRSRTDRIAAITELTIEVPDPERLKNAIMEPYRNAVAGLWSTLMVWSALQKLPFNFTELAELVPCYPGRLSRPVDDKSYVDPMHPSIVLGIVAQLGIPLKQLPPPPTDKQRATVGLCHAVPKFHRLFRIRSAITVRLAPIPFHHGLILDALVLHPQLDCVTNSLCGKAVHAPSTMCDREAYSVLRQCVEEANSVICEYPLLAEHCGFVNLIQLVDDLPNFMPYLESWFYCRELLANSLTDDTRLLGLFA